MELTTDILRTWFNRFNKEYFDGALSDAVSFEVSNSKHQLGQFCCTKRKSWLLKRPRPVDCVIKVSRYFEISEREIQSTLLHEMIHYYIISNGLTDTSPHGKIFRWHMNRLNQQYGWNITIRQNITEWKVSSDYLNASYLVLAVVLNDVKCVLSVVNPKYKDKIDKDAKRCEAVKSIRWFTSTDNYFIKYNKVRTFKGLFVDRKTFEEKCKDTKNEE